MLGEHVGRVAAEQLAHRVDQGETDGVLRDDQLDQPLPRGLARRQRLGQQFVEEEHLHAAAAHLRHEPVVFELGPLDPQHVVEEERVVTRRGQSLQAQVRAVDHHLAQFADL